MSLVSPVSRAERTSAPGETEKERERERQAESSHTHTLTKVARRKRLRKGEEKKNEERKGKETPDKKRVYKQDQREDADDADARACPGQDGAILFSENTRHRRADFVLCVQ